MEAPGWLAAARRSFMRRWPWVALALLVIMLGAGCGSGRGGSAAGRPSQVAQVARSHSSGPPTAPAGAARGASPAPSTTPAQSGTSQSSTAPSKPAQPKTAPGLDVHRTLEIGMHGSDVKQVQRRLAALKYYPGPADGGFGPDTLEAVWAFEEVQGLPATGEVNHRMLRALEHPRQPKVLVSQGGRLRVEVNLAHEVLVLYRGGKVRLISHVSSGGGYYYCSPGGGCGYAITPTGDYRTVTFMPGWITVPLGEMYNPVFFIGHAYAIHGDADVPLYPASHGCVRIPMDIATFFHTLLPDTGTPVYIRH
jgi:peptidoglycan hydrolase-like protein with peptidoglycan-binding domain